jgi:hypothetical protein
VNDIDSFIRVALGYDTAQFLAGKPLDKSVALLMEAQTRIAVGDDKRHCLVLTRLARAYLLLGEAKKSESFGRQGTELARRLGDRRSLFDLYVNQFLAPRQVVSSSDAEARLADVGKLVELALKINDDELTMRAFFPWTFISRWN